jgi:hypothetical protein
VIISHARRFIFVKTVKTAGSSLEVALARHCGPEDILTPLIPEEEALRRRLHGVGAQNYLKPLTRHGRRALARALLTGRREAEFTEHSSAFQIRQKVSPDIWRTYFKFTIVRDPYDRVMSRYFYTKATNRNIYTEWSAESFDQFLQYNPDLVSENWFIYTANGEVIVDFCVRYERMREDLAIVSERIGLSHNLFDEFDSIRAKGEFRPESSRGKVLSTGQRRLIDALCGREMALFGYGAGGDGRVGSRTL